MAHDEIARMLSERNQAYRTRDVVAIVAQHAADCVMQSPWAGTVTGLAAIREVYESWFHAFPDASYTSEEALIDGERVAEIAVLSGTDSGGFMGLPATNKPFKIPMVWLYTVRDNRWTHVRPVYDFTGMLMQIGVLKAKPM
jgi:steroid delta-isomerase-like uncharacterized protein